MNRFLSLLLALLLLVSAAAADDNYEPREVTASVVQDIPDEIQSLLDLAYDEWLAGDAGEMKMSNKYTKWRNDSKWGWCGGFITWCMLELGIPQQTGNKIQEGEVEGLVHVKEAGVGKIRVGYAKMNRLSRVPQKGFIAVFGNGKQFGETGMTPYYHVGLVYDAEELGDGKYRITTIEGNVDSPGDALHNKAAHTIRMYTRDYDMNAENPRQNITLVPEGERTQEESALFSYGYTYGNENLYLTVFLMPWIPEE